MTNACGTTPYLDSRDTHRSSRFYSGIVHICRYEKGRKKGVSYDTSIFMKFMVCSTEKAAKCGFPLIDFDSRGGVITSAGYARKA